MKESQLYGQGIGFPPRVGEHGRWVWSAGPQNIRESIQIILMTRSKERLLLPEFGGGLQQFLFEPNTVTTHRVIKQMIAQALDRWEPRITVNNITVEPDTKDLQAAVITIEYSLVASGANERMTLTMDLNG